MGEGGKFKKRVWVGLLQSMNNRIKAYLLETHLVCSACVTGARHPFLPRSIYLIRWMLCMAFRVGMRIFVRRWRTYRGNTCLHDALLKENYVMASLLISQGATLELANSAGITPNQLMTNLRWHPKYETTAKLNPPRTDELMDPNNASDFAK